MSASYRTRLAIVLSAATSWALAIIWLAFHPQTLRVLWQRPILPMVLVCVSVASVCLCYFAAKHHPGYGLGLIILAVNIGLLSVFGIAFALNLDNPWIGGIGRLTEVLLPLATAILIYQSVRKSRQEKSTTQKN